MKAWARIGCALLLVLTYRPHLVAQRAQAANYESTFQNARVHVFTLRLPPRASTPVYLANHDQVWIALADAQITLRSSAHTTEQLRLNPGGTRFISRGTVDGLTLDSPSAAEFIVVVINPMPENHEAASCDCTGRVAQSVCGCGKAGELPRLWAVAIGNLTIAGTSLLPEQSYPDAVDRDDMLLVAITPLALRDRSDAFSTNNGTELKLSPGETAWIPAGRHRFENSSSAPAQFVTLEF